MDKPLRICFLVQNLIHWGRWAKYLADRGHEIHIIGMEDMGVPEVHSHVIKFPQYKKYFVFILNIPHIRNLIRKIDPDIVHAYFSTNFGFVGALTAGRRPFAVSVAGSDIFEGIENHPLFRRINGFVFRRADMINAGALHAADAVQQYGIPASKIEVFPEGIDLNLFAPPENDPDTDQPVIICNRRFYHVYNVRLFVEAMPAIKRDLPDARFIMIGSGDLKEQIVDLIKEKGMEDAVDMHDEIPHEQMPDFLRRSNIYVSPSFSDGTSVSLLEAMAVGCFPVVTDIPTNREWVTDGETGFLVPVDRPDVLSEKVVRAFKEQHFRTEAKKKNLAIIKSKAEEGFIMDRLVEWYRKMIAEK